MKKIIYNLIGLSIVGLALGSCVDDYKDANPKPQLDGPVLFLSSTGDQVVASDTDDDEFTFVNNGGTARFEISIPDAPGVLDSVSFSLSNIQLPTDWGSVTVEGFDAVKGNTSGTFTVVYNAPLLDEESAFQFANENITIEVYDAQDPRKVAEITNIPTLRTVNQVGSDCFSNASLVGTYNAVSSGINGETGEAYSDLEAQVLVYLLKTQLNNPGYYRLDDGSFGLYALQGFAGNFINFEVCGDQVVGANEEFTYSGTVNTDGTIEIDWSTTFGDTGNTVLTPVE